MGMHADLVQDLQDRAREGDADALRELHDNHPVEHWVDFPRCPNCDSWEVWYSAPEGVFPPASVIVSCRYCPGEIKSVSGDGSGFGSAGLLSGTIRKGPGCSNAATVECGERAVNKRQPARKLTQEWTLSRSGQAKMDKSDS